MSMMGQLDEPDEAIVARVLSGDRSAYETLVRRHRRAAHAVALAVTGQREDAEDVCQDAFVQGFVKLASCRSPDRFGVWLLQIVRNGARNHRRHMGRRPTVRLESVPLPASPESPSADVDRHELRATLLRALAQLSAIQREVVLLSGLEDWAHARIAALLGISEVMSRRHLSDARRKLQSILAPYAASGDSR